MKKLFAWLALICLLLTLAACTAVDGDGTARGTEDPSGTEPAISGTTETWGNLSLLVPDDMELVGGSTIDKDDPDTLQLQWKDNFSHYYLVNLVSEETARSSVETTKEMNAGSDPQDVTFSAGGVTWTGVAYKYAGLSDCFQVYGVVNGSFVLVGAGWYAYDDPQTQAVLASIQVNEAGPETETTVPEAEDEASLARLREVFAESGDVCGVAYFGAVDGDYAEIMAYLEAEGLYNWYPFLAELPAGQVVLAPGQELYCVVPRDRDAEVTVSEWLLDESSDTFGKDGDVLYHSDRGAPILLRGNVSDIFPNLHLTVASGGETLDYYPSLSLENGALILPTKGPGVYNFSLEQPEEFDWTPVLEGTWVYDGMHTASGEQVFLFLTFDGSGNVTISRGTVEGGYDVYEGFTDIWEQEDGPAIMLDTVLVRSAVGAEGGSLQGEFRFDLVWTSQGEALELTWQGGDKLAVGDTAPSPDTPLVFRYSVG